MTIYVAFALATLGAFSYGRVLLQRGLRRKRDYRGGSPRVSLEDGWLIAPLPGTTASRCELRRVTTVAVPVIVGSRGVSRSVCFRGEGRCNCSVPLEAPGMREVMAKVSHWPGFDKAGWRRATTAMEAGRYPVWRGRLTVNAALEPDAGKSHFADGLRTAAAILSWDITYDALRNTPRVTMILNEFDREEYRITGPVWLGRLRLESMRVYAPVSINGKEAPRTDVPVVEWNASVVVTEAWGENYILLKQCFDAQFGQPHAVSSYEREDQAGRTWRMGEMSLAIAYTYNSCNSNDLGYCSLAVRNGRRYPAYLEDAYTRGMQLEQVVWHTLLPGKVQVATDFRRSLWVRQTPECLRNQADAGWVVWNDAGAGKLGFASGAKAVVIDRAQAVRLELQNATPARGGGYAELKLIDDAGRGVQVAKAGYRGLDGVVRALEEATGLNVQGLQEYLDD